MVCGLTLHSELSAMNLIIPAVALGAWYISTLKSTGEKLQRCEITSFKLGKLNIGLQETIIPVTLQVFNPNSTAVAAEYFRGKVFRAGIRIADFSFDSKGQNVQLQPRSNTPLTFNVRIGSVGAVKTIFDIFKNLFNAKALDTVFTIDGIITISGIDIPVQFSFDAKTGQQIKAVSGIGKPYAKMEFSSNEEMTKYFEGGCRNKMPRFSLNGKN